MNRDSLFENWSAEDAVALIREYPFAWVLPQTDPARGGMLPLLGETNSSGQAASLLGHMARSNPLCSLLTANPRAIILFQGPQGYVSPEIAGSRDWIPTWNFAQLRIEAEVRFEPGSTAEAVEALVTVMEFSKERPWSVDEAGPRYSALLSEVIAFRADILSLRGRFKLGQDESAETLRAIVAKHSDRALARWMKRANKHRL